MSIFTRHPRYRWAVPVVALATVGGATLTATMAADASTPLPPRTAAQLLADVQQARLTGLSGTVVQTSDLGLPALPSLRGGSGVGASSDLTSLVSGTHTLRVWYGGATRQRLALLGSLGESDIVRNGSDVWIWSSQSKSARHLKVPAHADTRKGERAGVPSPTDLPATPDAAARQALAAIDPTTQVTTEGTAVVAGRSAYELVLRPRDAASLVGQVRIAIDSKRHIPLRVQVYSTKRSNPAFEVGFSQVDFGTPEARQFTFKAPPGTTVTEGGSDSAATGPKPSGTPEGSAPAAQPKVVGSGWTSVVVATMPTEPASSSSGKDRQPGDLGQFTGLLTSLPKVSGTWGTGRLLSGTLVSAVVTDDGRLAVGAVAPSRLYAALAAK